MVSQSVQAAYDRLHEARPWHDGTFTSWVADPDEQHPFRFNMGVTIGVSPDPTPDDPFTTREAAPPPGLELADEQSEEVQDGGPP